MPYAEELNDIKLLDKEELEKLQAGARKVKPTSTHQLIIEEYKEELKNVPDGGGTFIPAKYTQRINIRRRVRKAADELGYSVTFTSNYRGGELVKVNKNVQT